ncbi:MAG: hypothetical protein VB144_08780 [Clostridia bacterium]|nr:hypothetical protein [Clostridia bacterium]
MVLEEFGMGPEPANGDGRHLYDRDGCYVTASGRHNYLGATLESEMEERKEGFDSVAYEKKGKGWFVLSWYKEDDILYLKVYVGPGAISTLHVQYPASMKERYDEVVTIMSRSFRPGDLE